MMESGIVFTPPLPVVLTQRVYRVGIDGSTMREVFPDGTLGETIPIAVANGEKKARLVGPPALLRRLWTAERALKRARTAERRAVSRVYAAKAALDAANGKSDPVTGTWSYKVTFGEQAS